MNSTKFELSGRKVWVAGHRGMVGSALVRLLDNHDCVVLAASRSELDLRRQADGLRSAYKWYTEYRVG